MDVLKNKSKINYEHVSRYAPFYIYYHTLDRKYMYGITKQLLENTSYVEVKVGAEDTLDLLAHTYYGRPDYYWVIADFNRITNAFIKLSDHFDKIKIPSLSAIEYRE